MLYRESYCLGDDTGAGGIEESVQITQLGVGGIESI